MEHLTKYIDSDIKIISDAHLDHNMVELLRKDYKIDLAQYDTQDIFLSIEVYFCLQKNPVDMLPPLSNS